MHTVRHRLLRKRHPLVRKHRQAAAQFISVQRTARAICFDDIVANVGGTIRAGRATTAEAVTASTTSAIYRAGSADTTDDETPDRGGSNPKYIENNIYIDGKKTARVLTPYISERQAFEK